MFRIEMDEEERGFWKLVLAVGIVVFSVFFLTGDAMLGFTAASFLIIFLFVCVAVKEVAKHIVRRVRARAPREMEE